VHDVERRDAPGPCGRARGRVVRAVVVRAVVSREVAVLLERRVLRHRGPSSVRSDDAVNPT
jgi:hypothetical protein